MNTKIKNFVLILFAGTLVLLVSCKGKSEKSDGTTTEQMEAAKKQGKEFTSDYVCPMHCEGSGSDVEGSCPKCGMAYVLNEEHKKDGHTH